MVAATSFSSQSDLRPSSFFLIKSDCYMRPFTRLFCLSRGRVKFLSWERKFRCYEVTPPSPENYPMKGAIDYSLNRLLPRIVETNRSVLELLAYDLDFLEVLLAILPLLYVVDTVAVSALELLHGCAVNGVHELH